MVALASIADMEISAPITVKSEVLKLRKKALILSAFRHSLWQAI